MLDSLVSTVSDFPRIQANITPGLISLTLSINDEEDHYGNNVSLWQSQTKEEREAKENRLFLGNGKSLWSDSDKGSKAPKTSKKEDAHDDLPFN